jgi:hypothetical protein
MPTLPTKLTTYSAPPQGTSPVKHDAAGVYERALRDLEAHPEQALSVRSRIVMHADATHFPAEIRALLPAPEKTLEGFVRVWGVASRGDCIYNYICTDESIFRLYRPGDVVFGPRFCESFRGLPFTVGHPDEGVHPNNAPDVVHGSIFEVTPHPAHGVVVMGVVLYTAAAIEAFQGGMTALSTGEWNKVLPYQGEVGGQTYDGILMEATGNHLALCEIGQAGPLAHLRSNSAATPNSAAPSPVQPAMFAPLGVGYLAHNAKATDSAAKVDQPTQSAPEGTTPTHHAPSQEGGSSGSGAQGDGPMKKIKFMMKDGTECEVEVPEAAADQIMAAMTERDDLMAKMQAELDGLKANMEGEPSEGDKAEGEKKAEEAAQMAVKATAQAVAQLVSLNGGKAQLSIVKDGKTTAKGLAEFGSVEEMQRAFLVSRFPKEAATIEGYSAPQLKVRLDVLAQHQERATKAQTALEGGSAQARNNSATDADAELAQLRAAKEKLAEQRKRSF